jgi:acetyl-CoA acetyltransferase
MGRQPDECVRSQDSARIGDVIVGCAIPEAEQGMNVARIGVLLAGLPNTVPGYTINRFCSSGLQAVADAAAQIRLGLADVMIAAGTESAERLRGVVGDELKANETALSALQERLNAFLCAAPLVDNSRKVDTPAPSDECGGSPKRGSAFHNNPPSRRPTHAR